VINISNMSYEYRGVILVGLILDNPSLYIYIYKYMCINTHICTCIYTYIYIHTYTYLNVWLTYRICHTNIGGLYLWDWYLIIHLSNPQWTIWDIHNYYNYLFLTEYSYIYPNICHLSFELKNCIMILYLHVSLDIYVHICTCYNHQFYKGYSYIYPKTYHLIKRIYFALYLF
jgi:hypothetical protein